jgi:hypothetical protein
MKCAGSDSIVSASPISGVADAAAFPQLLDAGAHGDMDWLAAHPERRADPRVLWASVRSVIMLGVNYGPDENPLAILEQRTRGAISVYAQGDDYHDLIKKRLKALARWLVAASGAEVKVFVDTAAVMEKPLAQAAGLGWQGKDTNLVSREFGSWLFLGAIFTTSDLPRDELKPTIAAPAPPARTSARPRRFLRPTSSMRGAAFPISRSRTRARSRTNSAKRSATESMAATIASRSVHGTSSRSKAARPSLPRAPNCAHRNFRNWRGSTIQRFARCL